MVFCPRIWSFSRSFYVLFSRMYLLWCLDRLFCRYLLSLFDVWCQLILIFFCLFLFRWPTGKSRVLKSLTINGLMLIRVFKSSSTFLMNLYTNEFSAYMFKIIISVWLNVSLLRMKCSSWSLWLVVVWSLFCQILG